MDAVRTKSILILAAFAMLLAFLSPLAARAEVIDRIVATVNGHIILQSDWNEALRFEALLSGRSVNDFNDDERRAVLDSLIDQELLGEQMKSNFFPHCTESEAVAKVEDARKQYPDASNDAGWRAVLSRFQFTEQEVVSHMQQQVDLLRLVDAHLRPEVQIDSKTIEAYYRDKFVPQLKQGGSGNVALSDVSGKIRELLTQEKVNELLVSWLQTLRSESQVRIPGANDSSRGGVQAQ